MQIKVSYDGFCRCIIVIYFMDTTHQYYFRYTSHICTYLHPLSATVYCQNELITYLRDPHDNIFYTSLTTFIDRIHWPRSLTAFIDHTSSRDRLLCNRRLRIPRIVWVSIWNSSFMESIVLNMDCVRPRQSSVDLCGGQRYLVLLPYAGVHSSFN